VAVITTLEEDQSTGRSIAVANVLVLGRGRRPVRPGRGEARVAAAIGEGHGLVAHSNIPGVASSREMRDRPLDGLCASVGVVDTRSLTAASWGLGPSTACRGSSATGTGVDVGVGHVAARHVVPDVGGAILAGDLGTCHGAIDVDTGAILD